MQNVEFQNLRTVKDVQLRLKPAALNIYRHLFPNCEVKDLREHGVNVHILDKEFGIDSLIQFKSNQWISIQEKYRDYPKWSFHDFTQETENGDGSQGEWYKLGAQIYFYGWGAPDKNCFIEWFILNIPLYKLIIEKNGGINQVGIAQQNKYDGKAKFQGIPLRIIKPAILYYGTCHTYFKRIDNNYFSQPYEIVHPKKGTHE